MPGTKGAGDQGAGGGQGDGNPTQIQITVGEETKMVSAEEVATAMAKAGNFDSTNEKFAPFKKVLDAYGIDSNEYLRNSEASFALMNQLISQGVIDEQGNVIDKKAGDGDNKLVIPVKPTGEGDEGSKGKATQVVLDALTKIGDRMTKIEDGQSNIYRRNINQDVKAVHSNLDDDDISKILAKAQADRSVGFWDHAKAASEAKVVSVGQTELSHAKNTIQLLVKAGVLEEGKVDLEKLDLTALKEQDPSKDPPVHEGKKFMFASRRRKLGKAAEEFTLPGDSMKEMLDKNLG